MTSDTSDIRGPISLTSADLYVRWVLSLMFVLCSLSSVSAWHTPCARSKFSLCSDFRGRYRDKTHEQSEGPKSVVCDVFSRTLRRSNHTRAHFLNRVTWSPRLLVIGLVALALLSMAQPTGSDDDEEDPGPSAIAIVASRINGALTLSGTCRTQERERSATPTAPALTPRRVHALEARISWHAGRSMLKSFCLLRC